MPPKVLMKICYLVPSRSSQVLEPIESLPSLIEISEQSKMTHNNIFFFTH